MESLSTPPTQPREPVRTVVVLGPTATGKTRLAVELARRFGGEIISADSRQVFRGLDIGTGKDLAEYGTGAARVRHHLIDIASPADEYSLHHFLRDAAAAFAEVCGQASLPVVAGGSALYINALLGNYHLQGGAADPAFRKSLEALPDAALLARLREEAPDLHRRTDTTQRRRILRALEIARTRSPDAAPPFPLVLRPLLIAPYFHRSQVHARISHRLDVRLAAGLVEEVSRLHAEGLSWERLESFGLEYRCVARHLQGHNSREEMREELFTRIRRFCRSQDVWFRKMEREGRDIHWVPGGDVEQAAGLVRLFLADAPLPEPVLRLKDLLYGPRSGKEPAA